MSNLSESTSRRKALLALGALGVVYGDIGTSPLYALREALSGQAGHGAVTPSPENVVGILSLIIWVLLCLIAVKYISVVMRADNDGEGGMLALLALAVPHTAKAGTAVSQRNLVLVVLAFLLLKVGSGGGGGQAGACALFGGKEREQGCAPVC